ncbi:hypothetical protein H4R20_001891 [Coemansia guatemalensis]|uniref:DUF4097 domain-containing protein n=1 Tax=Coemansia guatemalensis TaxID=2761395 RepID=A0A9W8LUI1_9FUNG|nr:hypothetical protein H4R20_001891 [Coemansia guatemalensis]
MSELERGVDSTLSASATASQSTVSASLGKAPQPNIEQTSSRSDTVSVDYEFTCPLSISTKGIRTTNVRIERAKDARLGSRVHVQAVVSSLSTTLHDRLRATSTMSAEGECILVLEVGGSIWDLGMVSAELSVVVPISDGPSDDHIEHPGIRISVPNGAIGATMLGNTHIRYLDLATNHGPAHLSDIAVGTLKLAAHNGNITVHDVCADSEINISGKAAWMDIDDVKASELVATSSDALISLKDVEAGVVSATTTNARIGLGNIKAGTLTVNTVNGDVLASSVQAAACEVKATKGNIEGNWCPTKKLYLSTTEAKIAVQVLLDAEESLEMALSSKNGPVDIDLPASFSGGFSLQTTGYYKAFIRTHAKVKESPVLHVSKPDMKTGVLSSGAMRHSLKAITEEAPVTVNFGSM